MKKIKANKSKYRNNNLLKKHCLSFKKIALFKKKYNFTEMLVFILIGILVGTIITLLLIGGKKSSYIKVDDEIQTLVDTYTEIKNNYYDDVDTKKVVDGGVKGMLEAVDDPYTTILDASSSNNFNISIQGSYEGLGLEISKVNNELIISGIFNDSGASEANLKLGDIIKSIDEKKTNEISSSDFSEYVINSTKTSFDLVVERDGKEINVNVAKKKIVLQSVLSKIIEKDGQKIGYIYVSIFALNTYDQFNEKLNELKKQGMQSLIIDLRNNTGGELSCATKMISLFLNKDKIIYQIADKKDIQKVNSLGTENVNYKIVILVNENSASASEIMTAALKDNLNVTIVGKKTYGKGTVQNLFQTTTGQEYKITSKKWLTPNGVWINGEGISPDLEVTMGNEYYKSPTDEHDNQLQEAIKQLKRN